MNIAHVLLEQAQQQGEAPALIDVHRRRERVMSFRELVEATGNFAAQLRLHGLAPGDGVLVLHPISIELYVFLIALFRMGCIGIFLDPSAGRDHIARCLEIYPPKAFFGSRKAQFLRLSTPLLRKVPRTFCPRWFPGTCRIATNITDMTVRSEQGIAAVEASMPALITFTSGSTGKPKAALRAHGFLIAQHKALRESLLLTAGTKDLTTLPIFVLANLASGVTSVLPDADMRSPGKIDAKPVFHQMQKYAIASTAASPAFISRLASYGRGVAGTSSHMRHVFMGGAPVFPHHLREGRALFPNAEITAVYGSTEAEPMAEISLSEIKDEDFAAMNRGAGLLAGVPVKSIDLRILRDQWGSPIPTLAKPQFEVLCLPAGQVGEIAVSGEHVLAGYLNGEGDLETRFTVAESVAESVEETRWHRTGDLGLLDAKGRLWLMGRASATIRDDRGVLHPFAAEAAAMQIEGVRRAALLQVARRRVLAIETTQGNTRETVAKAMAWAQLDEIRVLPTIPMDKRHNAKVDYVALAAMLSVHQDR